MKWEMDLARERESHTSSGGLWWRQCVWVEEGFGMLQLEI